MVARKHLPGNPPADLWTEPPRIEVWSATDTEVDSERIWGEEEPASTGTTSEAGSPNIPGQVPSPLRPGIPSTGPASQGERNPWDDFDKDVKIPTRDEPNVKLDEVPIALRPGAGRPETNPFKRKPVQTVAEETANSTSAEPPVEHVKASQLPKEFSLLQIDESVEQSTNPWQPALGESARTQPSLLDQDSDRDVWSSNPQLKSSSPILLSTQSTGNAEPWNDIPPSSSSSTAPIKSSAANDIWDDEHAWEEEKPDSKGKQPAAREPNIQPDRIDGWNIIDPDSTLEPVPGSLSRQSTWENFVDAEGDAAKEATARDTIAHTTTVQAPPLPPRSSLENQAPSDPGHQYPIPLNVDMSETYQIKLINWQDAKATKNPRNSPILVQNLNGPCPLVALVNALTLTTPADQDNTNLIETLRSREQISLKFLLEAVVDELITARHTEADAPLPDMSELYAFLLGLHTGMNVNPRFIPSPDAVAATKPTSLSHTHSSDRDATIPGTFEKTRDMELYAAFSIPLIHGWLPPRDDPAYDALSRQAPSYDDAQNILFREEELEDKFSNSQTGLTDEEQQLYQDIITIKSFLSLTATQLTPSGLDVINKSMKPGGVSILFRNDHFSTLYRHPQSLQLFTLVTDAGFFTHDEVVWESLVDVRGERAQFFSGDFRVVGGQHQRPATSQGEATGSSGEGDWQTVQNRRSRRQGEPPQASAPTSLSQSEQEDQDLALALQLQEEEEDRHRAEQAARRREAQLNEQQGRDAARNGSRTGFRTRGGSTGTSARGSTHSLPPPRRSSLNETAAARGRGGRVVQQVRSLIPPQTHRPAEEGLEDAPPSYEQAAKSTPYVPPDGHPSHPESDPRNPRSPVVGPAARRTSTLTGSNSAGPSTPTRPQRHSISSVAASGAAQGNGRNRECTLM